MRALLIRHGKTQGNSERRYIGVTDEPLSDEGRAEVERVRPDSSLKLVYVSPLLRARQTASILFPQAEQRVIPDLRETDFGVFEGRSADEMFDDADYREWVDGMCLGTCPGGESRAEFSERACSAFLSILDMEQRITPEKKRGSDSEDLIIVSHGGTQMAILERWGRPARDYYDWQRPCGCGWKLSLKKSEKTASEAGKMTAAEHDIIELHVLEEICFIHQ